MATTEGEATDVAWIAWHAGIRSKSGEVLEGDAMWGIGSSEARARRREKPAGKR